MKKFALSFLAAITLLCVSTAIADTRSNKADISKNLNIFTSIFKELQTSYVDTIDANKTMKIAIGTMLYSIDPYTEYIPKEEQDEFMTISTGEFGGIGAYITQEKNGDVIIDLPQENTPSEHVGLKAGDKIIAIDGDTVLGIGSDKVRNRLRGQAGSNVKVTVRRPFVKDSILTFDIKREKITVDPVPYYGVVADGVGYIGLTTFNEKSYTKVREALEKMKAENGINSVILDLRSNGGGLMESAIQIVGIFVDKGTEVLVTRGKGDMNNKVYKTTVKPVDTKIPVAILIDESSASSSEIVTGAMQDLDRAVIVGNRSYGKGLVQSTRQIPYDGLLKVTIAKYYIPSGRCIQAIDYSLRKEDGSVQRTPDSLTHVFYTKNQRPVRDGGGITPDIKVDYPKVSKLTEKLVRDKWVFNYSVYFAANHDSISSEKRFVVDDSIYNDFKKFIDPKKLDYDKSCETLISRLESAAKDEGYYNDEVKANIDTLKTLLHHDLNRDLDINRKAISFYLESDIVTRIKGNRGAIIHSVKDDIAVDSAISVLKDVKRYESILKPEKNK